MPIAFVVSIVLIFTIRFIGTAGRITIPSTMILIITDQASLSHGAWVGVTQVTVGDTQVMVGATQVMVGVTIHHITAVAGAEVIIHPITRDIHRIRLRRVATILMDKEDQQILILVEVVAQETCQGLPHRIQETETVV